ncbi:M56 family metallopeptidase [Robertkochia marina]|nr:M56 family metallopeptidase [Robertkochia marina]
MYYIIWTSISLTLFYGVYKLAFNEAIPAWAHRVYLIFTLCGSLLLPFQPFALSLGLENNAVTENFSDLESLEILTSSQVTSTEKSIDLWTVLGTVYTIVLALMLLRFLWQFIKMYKIYRRAGIERSSELVLIKHPSIMAPFSFFNYVFINEKLVEEERYEQVLTHEQVHARQFHSIDIILAELFIAFFWFHPLAWTIKNKIVLIHEYLADDGVLQTGVDKTTYQVLLLNQIAEGRLICLSSNFNHSLIKKRILMMSKSNVNPGSGLRLLVLLPITMLLCLAIACTNAEEPEAAKEEMNIPPPPPPLSMEDMNFDDATFVVDGKEVSKAEVNKIGAKNIQTVNIVKGEHGDQFEIVTKPQVVQVAKKINYEDARKLFVVDGEIQKDDFEVSSIGKENIKSVNIIGLQEEIKKYTDGDYDRVVIIETK